LYQPQAGHTVCGSLAAAQRGHTLREGAASFQLPARRLRVFDFDFFFLGTAMMTPGNGEGASLGTNSYKTLAARRPWLLPADRRIAGIER
jgi:hypothetical protein